MEEEDAELALSQEELEAADFDATQAGALQLLAEAESLGGGTVAPKAAEINGALEELDSLLVSEREVLAKAAALLRGFGVTLPLPPAAGAGADADDDAT